VKGALSARERAEGRNGYPCPFIVGAARSGTTLLRLMLDAHPDLAIPPETHFIPKAVRRSKRSWRPRRAFFEALTSSATWGDQKVESALLKERLATIRPFNVSDALRAFYRLYAEKFGKTRWGDKTPPYVLQMQLIEGLLPEVRFVHITRDGRDVALSMRNMWWSPGSIEEIAQWWILRIKEARRQSEGLRHYMEVRYEDVVVNTEQTLRKVSEFIDLPWNTSMLDYTKTSGERMREIDREIPAPDGARMVQADERLAIHALTTKPPQSDRIGRWKTEMPGPDRKRFEAIAGETLQALGYEV
jgi:hypothetical protein